MKRTLAGARWILVTVGIIVLTSFSIDATTHYSVSQSALGILARNITDTGCGPGMVELSTGVRRFCVDRYEVSADVSCPHSTPTNISDTRGNLDDRSCVPQSVAGAQPWVYVNINQARELCARVGKRLPTHGEWHHAALGISDPEVEPVCNIASASLAQTGSWQGCVSGSGAYDMVGNAWEWIDAAISDGLYGNRELPEEGYVDGTDQDGVALATTDVANSDFHKDYFWSKADGAFMSIRGGFYGSGTDAGIYSIHADMAPSFSSSAIGFRCVKDLSV